MTNSGPKNIGVNGQKAMFCCHPIREFSFTGKQQVVVFGPPDLGGIRWRREHVRLTEGKTGVPTSRRK
jgi:hypothetical protein